jgi:poly(3-hydroxyalkanoate) depolymerase
MTRQRDFTRTINVAGQKLRVRVRRGVGVPLLLCNGIGASLEVLDPLVDNLESSRTVIRFDVPGTGMSPAPILPLGFPQLAWMVGCLLDQLGHARVDVLGYSWGGALAQQYALQNPHRCRRLVLVATATGALMVPAKPSVLTKMLTPRRFTDPDYLASIAHTLYGGTSGAESAIPVAGIVARHHPGSARGYLYQLIAGAGWTSLFALPAIRQPTLLIAGSDDPIIPMVNARIMDRLLPNATLEVHTGGHIDLLSNASSIAPVIDRFLNRHNNVPRSRQRLWRPRFRR